MKSLEMMKDYYHDPLKFGEKNHSCKLSLCHYFFINIFGNVSLCSEYPSLGNLFDCKPFDVWRSRESRKQRKLLSRCQRECKICFF